MIDTRRAKAKVCLVGEAAVGKTKLIRRFVLDRYDDAYLQTLGTRVYEKAVTVFPDEKGPVLVDLGIWDVMGQKGFRELLKDAYLYHAHGILAVCDVTRKETLADLDGWIKGVQSITGPVPMIVLANKSDLRAQADVTEDDVSRTADAYEAPFLWTSAKTGENVERAFHGIAERIVRDQRAKAEAADATE